MTERDERRPRDERGERGKEPERKKRRALTNVGGEIETAGDADDAAKLAQALEVAPSEDDDDDPSRAHVHGFHTYPARMHPETASRLVRAFAGKGARVLDPFCGSGTVLVEGMVAGARVVGTDLSGLAVRLARCKTRVRGDDELDALVELARESAAFADDRRVKRAGATRRFSPEDMALFEPHVLLELDSLRDSLTRVADSVARDDLSLVLSALLVKLSKKRGDTSDAIDTRRTAAGYTAKLFIKKTEDLARRHRVFRARVPAGTPIARVEVDDATKLATLGPRERIDAIVTSPPYAATYDYVAHHALRSRWLGLDSRPLEKGEIGARRNYAPLDGDRARDAWVDELGRFFRAAARVLAQDAPMILVMADSAVRTTALRADDIVAFAAEENGFVPAARASQPRPHFHGPTQAAFRDRPRAEHALLVRRA